jgi:hypothetical protein
MSTISAYLDEDIALHMVASIDKLIARPDETVAVVTLTDGSVWEYLDQNTASTTGEIARQIVSVDEYLGWTGR